MTTNYSEWNRWNEEEELLRVEQDWTLEEVSHELLHSEKRVISLLENLIQKIQNLSIALRSKAAVESLKKSNQNRRRRNINPPETSASSSSSASSASVSSSSVSSSSSPASSSSSSASVTSPSLPPVPAPLSVPAPVAVAPIVSVADAMEKFTKILEIVIQENIKIVRLLDAQDAFLANESCYTIMMKLPHLEDAFNAVFVAIEKVPGVNFTQINPEEIEGQTLLAIAETREKVNFIMANTTATLALCALSMNDYAAAADFSRCHLKLFGNESNKKEQQNEVADSASDPNVMMQVKKKQKEATGKSSIVAMWVIRGRAMIGLGCPYLASLHFNQVKSLRSSFPKIEVILAALQDAQVLTAQHTSSIGLMTLQDLIEYEVHRLFISPLNSGNKRKQRKHLLSSDVILQDISRCLLSPLTISLSLHSHICTPCMSSLSQYEDKVTAMQSKACSSHLCPSPAIHRNPTPSFPSLHMSDDSLSSSREAVATPSSVSSQQTAKSLQKSAAIARAAFPRHLFPLISAEIQSRSASASRSMSSLICYPDSQAAPSTVPLDQHTICSYLLFIRRAFYSAQILYLEGLYRSAEIHYWSSLVLIFACLHQSNLQSLLSTHRFPSHSPQSSLPTIQDYLIFYFSSALLNIASCQSRQPIRRKPSPANNFTSSPLPIQSCPLLMFSLPSLLVKSPEDLCDVVVALLPHDPIPSLRKALILNHFKSYDQSIDSLQQASDAILRFSEKLSASAAQDSPLTNHDSRLSHFVLDHGDRAIFSQCFLGKINIALPFMNCEESEEDVVRAIHVVTTFITALMEKNLRLRHKD